MPNVKSQQVVGGLLAQNYDNGCFNRTVKPAEEVDDAATGS